MTVIVRPPPAEHPLTGRKLNGTSNYIRTSSLDFSSDQKLAMCWWEYSSTSTTARCVFETGVNGFPVSGPGIGVWRNDIAANTVEVAWTNTGTTLRYFTSPTANQWNFICANIDATAATGTVAMVPGVWVNGVAPSLTHWNSPGGAQTGGFLPNAVINIGARNGASNWNDFGLAQLTWVCGYQWTEADALAMYAGQRHPAEYLRLKGTKGFCFQQRDLSGSGRLPYVKGVTTPSFTAVGGTPQAFNRR